MTGEEKTTQWLSTLASLMVGTAFFALWFWLLPGWLGFRVDLARPRWRWIVADILETYRKRGRALHELPEPAD